VASCPLLSSRSCFLEPTCLTCTFLPQAQGIRSHTPQSTESGAQRRFAAVFIDEWFFIGSTRGLGTAEAAGHSPLPVAHRAHWQGLAVFGPAPAPRDLARIARLLLTQGRHDHQAVLPAASVTDSSTRRQTGRDGHGYGAQCWQGPFEVGAGSGVGWTGGWANGGQRVCAVPSFDLVMVVTAGR